MNIFTRKIGLSLALGGSFLTLVCSPALHASDERKIATAVQRGGFVYAYDEKGSQMFSVSAGSGEKDGLVGYTSSTLSVRRGGFVYVYNDKGSQISSVSAGN
jgi:hypothetical protein